MAPVGKVVTSTLQLICVIMTTFAIVRYLPDCCLAMLFVSQRKTLTAILLKTQSGIDKTSSITIRFHY